MSKSTAVQQVLKAPRTKLFYRINEVARMTGLKPYVLRYWETEFRELAPSKDSSDQRRYRPADIEVILAIRKLLYEDRFTIEGARKRLREELRRLRGQSEARGSDRVRDGAPAAGSGDAKANATLINLRREVNELLELLGA